MQPDEVDRLRGLPPLAVAVYVLAIRPQALAGGRIACLTRADLRAAVSTPPRRGTAAWAPTVDAVRHALSLLEAAGLVFIDAVSGRSLRLRIPQFELPPTLSLVKPGVTEQLPPGMVDRLLGTTPGSFPVMSKGCDTTAPEQGDLPGFPPSPLSPLNPLTPTPPIPSRARVRLRPEWEPSPETILALRQKGVPEDVARGEVGHFRLYWSAQRGNEASKTEANWQLAFVKWAVKLKPKTGGTNANATRDRDLGAAGRQAVAIADYFAGRRR